MNVFGEAYKRILFCGYHCTGLNVLCEEYKRSLAENQRHTTFWQNYLCNLKDLDFNFYSSQMKVSTLIPIGSRMLFRGDLIHTNEVTVALGSNYFAKCSAMQAQVLKQHRIQIAEEKLNVLQNERDFLENQLSFTQMNVFKESGQEIIEPYIEEQENVWRIKHKENLRNYKTNNNVKSKHSIISDEDLWRRLEELELREELDEYSESSEELSAKNKPDNTNSSKDADDEIIFMQQFQERMQEVNKKIVEITNKNIAIEGNEDNLFKRLDQLEEQEALEEELDRLENIDSDIQDGDNSQGVVQKKIKKTLSFASDEESFCVNIHFKHSKISPELGEYKKESGITKPSDIYAAFPENFENRAVIPILKKSDLIQPQEIVTEANVSKFDFISPKLTDVIGEVIENPNENKIIETTSRPQSKFKTMRMRKN